MSDQQQQQDVNIEVVLRLRPMNKLEASRRSRNCVELHEDPRSLTVDSPLEGEYDFEFDHVLEEYATQQEVYDQSLQSVASKLLDGYDCTVILYGQTGTGKSHTLLGETSSSSLSLSDDARDGRGMILRISEALFDLVDSQKNNVHTEFTIKCCFVEIYLEKVLDLLLPGGTDGPVGISPQGEILNAAHLCCVCQEDIENVLARGSAHRTQSALELGTDSSRSHAVFGMSIVSLNTATGTTKRAQLLLCDLAGSELASLQRDMMGGAVQTEAKMVNRSLAELHKLVRDRNVNDEPTAASTKQCKLTRLLANSFGGRTYTTLILTASPSSYNIGETINTIKFGQKCRAIVNHPLVNEMTTADRLQIELEQKQEKLQNLLTLVKDLAQECGSLMEQTGNDNREGQLWSNVRTVLELGGSGEELEVVVRPFRNDEVTDSVRYQSELEEQLAELKSEVAVLRTQNEEFAADKKRHSLELMDAKNEIQVLSQRKTEVEHNLRTSQFRENEAVVFLRQFRRFYRNVLRDKARHGSGSLRKITEEIGQKASNAPDLNQLVDIDALMVESGLLEEYEVNDDRSSATYGPSKEALVRSAAAAEKAAAGADDLERDSGNGTKEVGSSYVTASSVRSSIRRIGTLNVSTGDRKESISDMGDGGVSQFAQEDKVEDARSNDDASSIGERECGPDAGAGAGPGSAVIDVESSGQDRGSIIAEKAKLLLTPAGRLATMRERELEREVLEMSERVMDLQMALNEEKATVEALSSRSGGLSKKKLAQEAIALRQQLEKMNENLMAIAWKMNELNLINKSYNEKMVNREQHVIYLEENLVDLQNANRRIVMDRQEAEKKLRDEIESLKRTVDKMAVPLWQFREGDKAPKPSVNRIVVSRGAGPNRLCINLAGERRMSTGEEEAELDREYQVLDRQVEQEVAEATTQTESEELSQKIDAGIQTEHDHTIDTSDAQIQTDPSLEAPEGFSTATIERDEESSFHPDSNEKVKALGDIDAGESSGLVAELSAVLQSDSSASGDLFVPADDERADSANSDQEEIEERPGLADGIAAAANGVGLVSTARPKIDIAVDEDDLTTSSPSVYLPKHAPKEVEDVFHGDYDDVEEKWAKRAAARAPSAPDDTYTQQSGKDEDDRISVSSDSDETGGLEQELATPLTSTSFDDEFFEKAKQIGHKKEEAIETMGASDDELPIDQSQLSDESSLPQPRSAHDNSALPLDASPGDAVATSINSDQSHGEEKDIGVKQFDMHEIDNNAKDLYAEKKTSIAAEYGDSTKTLSAQAKVKEPEDANVIPAKPPILESMLLGGKSEAFEPRRFVDKLGQQIRPGLMKELKKSSRESTRRKNEDEDRRSSIHEQKEKKHKKKKKKKSVEMEKKKKKSSKKSYPDKDRSHRGSSRHRKNE